MHKCFDMHSLWGLYRKEQKAPISWHLSLSFEINLQELLLKQVGGRTEQGLLTERLVPARILHR